MTDVDRSSTIRPEHAPKIESGPNPDSPVRVVKAALVLDDSNRIDRGAVVLRPGAGRWVIDQVGPAASVSVPPNTETIDLGDAVLMPALVNAHTHLDLTHVGPREHDPSGGFMPWIDMILENRAVEPDDVRASVRAGIERSVRGGVVAVGDISGAPRGAMTIDPGLELARSGLLGVSFIEYFGMGKSAPGATERLAAFLRDTLPNAQSEVEGAGVTLGISPHATNTIDLSLYRFSAAAARDLGLPLCTHLSETREELEFIAQGTGTQRAFLERFGGWDDSVLDHIGKGKHPVEHLSGVLETTPVVAAHVNHATDRAIEILAQTGTAVVYCARAHRYFGHEADTPHRYKDMINAGVTVCLGTDSIVNLDTEDRISVLDDMRLIHSRDRVDARALVKMVTTSPAKALGIDPDRFRFMPGAAPAGLIAVDARSGDPQTGVWDRAMGSSDAPDWVVFQP